MLNFSHFFISININFAIESHQTWQVLDYRYGRMLFVDLAGSERLKKSKSSGEMLKETGSINRSLFTLGKVNFGMVFSLLISYLLIHPVLVRNYMETKFMNSLSHYMNSL